MLGTDDEVRRPGGTDRTRDRTWPAPGGWTRWLTVAGADLFSFCDAPCSSGTSACRPGTSRPEVRFQGP
ncbi:hypothetical protein ABZ924_18025 [Streptomyces sp. NPDC046876]|uniref:hypothetical protein n=1 Tax=Streptomyces sp. NPDC046876 TaxID=3155616 RepID=UPI0033DC184B